jgi:CMP-N,N'-diacetyllegionaminic acid synthase
MVISVKETRINPYSLLFEENSEGWLEKTKKGDFVTRQTWLVVYQLNGAIYIVAVLLIKEKPMSQFTSIKKYIMDEMSSHDSDTMLDWMVAEMIMRHRGSYNG